MKRVIASFVVTLLGLMPAAQAHDHRPPSAVLHTGGHSQRGWLHHADGWARAANEPGMCVADFITGIPRFPRPVAHEVGDEIVIRLRKPAAPLEVEVKRWPGVDEDGHPTGTAIPLPWLLRPRLVQDEIRAWEVVVLPPVVDGHLYLDVGAYWADEDGCYPPPDLGSQYAAWMFHLVAS